MRRSNCGFLITVIIGITSGIIGGYNAFLTLILGIETVIWIALGIGLGALVLLI